MEDILYVKVEQNMVVQKKTLTYEDIATLYCQNQNIVKKLNKEIFYTLDPKQQKTMFTIEKVYQGIHKVYPGLRIENVGERDFIEKKKAGPCSISRRLLSVSFPFSGLPLPS